MSDKPLQDEWEGFARAAVHPMTPEWQRAEMRRIFMAGALAMQVVLADATDRTLDGIAREMTAFEAEIDQLAALGKAQPAGRV